MRLVLALALTLACAAALAQMVPNQAPMTPQSNGPGPQFENMIPNEGDMTPNAVSGSAPVGCAGTGYDFTQACNSQYVVVL